MPPSVNYTWIHQVNGDTMPSLLKQMGELHIRFADPDGFLYFNFFSQENLGWTHISLSRSLSEEKGFPQIDLKSS